MDDFVDAVPVWSSQYPPPRRPKRWLLVGGATLALLLALGVGALVGSQIATSSAAAAATTGGSSLSGAGQGPGGPLSFQAPGSTLAGTSGPSGKCEVLTVTAVSGSTIAAKAADGSTLKIETTAATRYTQNGQSATLTAVKVGSRINVMGTHNSDGSITASSIDIS